MSKKKNLTLKNATSLIITSLFFSSAVFANDYVESAKKYLAKNETNAAIIQLKNAIKQEPNDSLSRYLLGKIYLEQGDFLSAERQLSRALKHNYDKDIVSPLLARALINQSKYEDAFLFIHEIYPEDIKMPNDLIALAAIAEIKLKNLASAQILLNKITKNTLYAQMANALYDFVSRDFQTALTTTKDLLKTYSENSELWLLKGHIESSMNKIKQANASYIKAFEFAPKAYSYPFFIARSFVQLKEFDKAAPLIDRLLNIDEKNALVNELKAITVFANNDFTNAKLFADRALNSGLQNFRLMAISGVSAYNLNQLEHSYKIFKKLTAKLPKTHPINRLYVITQFKLGYVDEAIENIEKIPVDSVSDSKFLSQISVELTKIGRNDLALKFAKKAENKAEGDTETILNFVKLANNDDSGLEELYEAIEKEPASTKVKKGLANYYLVKGMHDEAEKIADEWLKDRPDDVVALAIKGLIHKKKNEVELAKKYFEQILTLDLDNLQAIVELSKIESAQGNHKDASALLKKAKFIDSDNQNLANFFLSYHQKMNTLNQAIEIIDQQINNEPLNSALKIQKAKALAMKGDKSSAIVLVESLPDKDKSAWRTLVSFYASTDDKNNLKRSYQGWLSVDKFNPTAYLANAKFLLKENALNESLKTTNKAQEIFADDIRFKLIKTEILLKQAKVKSANEEFNKIAKDVSNNAEYDRIKGRLQIANKDFDGAIETYKKRFALQPNSVLALEIASLYRMNQQNDQAIDFLNELVTKYPDSKNKQFLTLKMFLAELMMDVKPEKSIALYSAIVEVQPKNAVALNNLSWLLFDQNKIEQACDFGKKAHELAKKNISIADTYGYCLLKNGNTAEALNLLEYAYKGKKEDANIALHFAEALIEVKQIDKAAKVLAEIVSSSPEILAQKKSLEKTVVSLIQ